MKFTELLEEFDIPQAPEGHEHSTEGWVQFDCPFCGKDSRHYHMGYNISGGFTNCWRCGSHSVASVLMEYSDLPYRQIKKMLDEVTPVRIKDELDETVKTKLVVPAGIDGLKPVHIKYLENRGYDPTEVQRLWQIKGIGVIGRLKWRIFIPILYNNKVVSWTTRALSDRVSKKYWSAKPDEELIPHKELLYGMDYVRHTAIIVEGPLDVWAIGPGAVATFGTGFTKQQVLKLLGVPRKIICYDAEKEAQKQAHKLSDALGGFGGETVIVQLDSKDPGEAKSKELKYLRKFLK